MQKENIINLLNGYNPSDSDEQHYKRIILDFVGCNEIISGKENKNGHLTGSAFIVNNDFSEILLVNHAKLNKWLQPGGHSDIGELLFETAKREAVEETGLTCLTAYQDTKIFDLDVHLIPARKNEQDHYHYDIRFLFVASVSQKLQLSDESHDLKWVKVDQIEQYSGCRSILRMVDKISMIRSMEELLLIK